ncbi:MAG: amidohydrolase family protein [Acidimicrobiales bacterium]|jgi:2-pyrone-4,6-dicarboxylate lactonase
MSTTFSMDSDWLVFDPDPSKPTFTLPVGAVDAHCHVFGPGAVFPYAPERKYTPCDAGKDDLFRLRDFLGVSKNVVVQATCHGSDNAAMLDVLTSSHGRARGVATVSPDISETELLEMHEQGVRGVRFNYVRRLVDPQPDVYYHRIVEKIAPLGWHVVIYFEAADLDAHWDFFTSLETRVVVDHMGRPDVAKSVDGPEFASFLRLMSEHENFWSKVTCPERISLSGPPEFADAVPFARRVIEKFPDRVLWGTDWPHPNLKGFMPDDGKIVDFVPRIAPTPEHQQKLLVVNPERLYWEDD